MNIKKLIYLKLSLSCEKENNMSRIFIINGTTIPIVDKNGIVLNETTIKQMIWACNEMVSRFAHFWDIVAPKIVYYTGKWEPQTTDWQFQIIDTDAEAYHREDHGLVDGYILAKTIVDNGGFILSDKSISSSNENEFHVHASQQSTVAGALFHEIVEALMDSTINSWWQSNKELTILHGNNTNTKSATTFNNGLTMCCSDVCGPVQQNFIVIKLEGIDIALSDFILPAWKDSQNKIGPFNYIRTLKEPFTVDVGGYLVILDSTGNGQQVFSKNIPDWVREYKFRTYRSNKRNVKVQEPEVKPIEEPEVKPIEEPEVKPKKNRSCKPKKHKSKRSHKKS